MVTITFDEIAYHDAKGDLKEWAKEKRLDDKQRQALEDMMQRTYEKFEELLLYGGVK